MAFKRREQALSLIARVRSVSFQIYLAHAVWTNWNDGTGRTNQTVNRVSPSDRGSNDSTYNDNIEDWLHHADDVMEHLVAMGDELSRFLTLPSSSRSYHRLLHNGRKEAAEIVELQYKLFDSLYTKRFKKLTILTEKLRVMGLSPPEISRIWQFKQQIAEAIESLRVIKMYRTPQALRSFGRLFIIVLPPLYASSFAQLAFDLQSLPMGIIFAFITPLCLTGKNTNILSAVANPNAQFQFSINICQLYLKVCTPLKIRLWVGLHWMGLIVLRNSKFYIGIN